MPDLPANLFPFIGNRRSRRAIDLSIFNSYLLFSHFKTKPNMSVNMVKAAVLSDILAFALSF